MVTPAFDTVFVLDASPNFRFTDTTDYAGLGILEADVAGVFSITFPDGSSYTNSDYNNPDVEFNNGQLQPSDLIPIPVDSSGKALEGLYDITYSIQVSGAVHPGVWSTNKTYTLSVTYPTMAVQSSANEYVPEVVVVDNTDYGSVDSVARQFIVEFPSQSGESNQVFNDVFSLGNPEVFEGQYGIDYTITASYVDAGDSTFSWEIVNTGSVDVEVPLAWSISELNTEIDEYKALMDTYKSKNSTTYKQYREHYFNAISFLSAIRESIYEGDLSDVPTLAEDLISELNEVPNSPCGDTVQNRQPSDQPLQAISLVFPAVPTEHNQLSGLQGGQSPDEYYHLTAAQIANLLTAQQKQDLLDLLYPYQAPTVSIDNGTPALPSQIEVGDTYNQSTTFVFSVNNIQNVRNGEWYADDVLQGGAVAASQNIVKTVNVTGSTAGSQQVVKGHVIDDQSGSEVAATRSVQRQFRVFWFLHDAAQDLTQETDGNIQSVLDAIKGSANVQGVQYHQLRGNANVAPVGSDIKWVINQAPNTRYLYVVFPDSYAVPSIASKAFPSSPVNLVQSTFNYTNNGNVTTYRIIRMQDVLGFGEFESVIYT